jgi:ubiquinone biosynthesis protein
MHRDDRARVRTTRRIGVVLVVLLRAGVAHLVSWAAPRVRWLSRMAWTRRMVRVSAPERLRDTFEELGGAFLKFGQMLALQPDIVPVAYCNALFDLLDRVPPFAFSDVEQIFVEDLGCSVHDVFDSIDHVPVASASIGQVHVAMLGSRKVAVKVQRPTARAQFASDIRLMSVVIGMIQRLHLRWFYWLLEPMTEFVAWTHEELDYRCEARYMERLRRNAENNRYERVPRVLWRYLTPRILVADFLEGETVLAYLRRRESTPDPVTPSAGRAFEPHMLARNIIDNFLSDVFQHGMFHADLHPANLLILPNNVVGYIDFGITGIISRYSRQNIVALTLAYTRGDLAGMCAAFFRVSATDERSEPDRFRAGLEAASRTWYADGVGGRRLRKNFTLVMLDMLRLSRETRIWPARDVIKYIRSAIAVDGLITRLAPTFDVRQHIEDVCSRHLTVHLSAGAAIQEAVAAGTRGLQIWRLGGTHAAAFFQQLAEGKLPVRFEVDPPLRGAPRANGVVAAACVAAVGVSILGLPQGDAGIATAELSVLACIVAVLARGGVRAARSRRRW